MLKFFKTFFFYDDTAIGLCAFYKPVYETSKIFVEQQSCKSKYVQNFFIDFEAREKFTTKVGGNILLI